MTSTYKLKGDTSKAAEFELKFKEASKYGDASIYNELLIEEKIVKIKTAVKQKNLK